MSDFEVPEAISLIRFSRILGRELGGKQNILVLNDEAHHATLALFRRE